MNDQFTFVSRPFFKAGANLTLKYIGENWPNLCDFGAVHSMDDQRKYRIVVISDRIDVLADIKEYIENSSIL